MIRFDAHAKYAFIAACLALVGSGLGFRVAVSHLNIYLQKEPVHLREHFATIPRSLDSWRAEGQDAQFDAAMLETLGTDVYLDRTYGHVSDDSVKMSVHLAYYTGMIDAIPHVPDRCMVAGGFDQESRSRNVSLDIDTTMWIDDPEHVNRKSGVPYPLVSFPHRIRGDMVTVRMPLGEFAIRVTEFSHRAAPNGRIFAGFFFIANGHVTANPLDVRALAFDKTDKYAYYCKVQFTMFGDADFDEAAFAAHVSDILTELLPEIMRCLPDWAEVEARSDKAKVAVEQDRASERQG